MKKILKTIVYLSCLCITLMLALGACKKDHLEQAPRLFRPTLKGSLLTTGNFIEASWEQVKNAESYTIQISRDTFKTIDISLSVDTAGALIENLKWDQLYQIQVRANAADSTNNSRFGLLGSVKTPKFPTILSAPTINDVTDNSVIMRWRTEGAAVSTIKVFDSSGLNLLKTIELNASDINDMYRVIDGLQSATSYYMELYSQNTLRGYNTYTTKAPFAGQVIDLRGFADRPSVLQDTLTKVPSGSVIVLKKGVSYPLTTSLSISQTLMITSGDDLLTTEPATIDFAAGVSLNFSAGAAIDSVAFVNVNLKGNDYANNYVFNADKDATIGRLSFNNCKTSIFRGVIRLKSGNINVENFEMNNCLIDSIGSYNVLIVDNATCKINNIAIRNSTITRTEQIIVSSKREASSVIIDACTFYKAPRGGAYLIDFGSKVVSGGLVVSHCIFAIGKDNNGNNKPRGVRAPGSILTTINNYGLADYANGGEPLAGLQLYSRPSNEVFTDPAALNFKIKDQTFPGRSTSGDPRWR